MRRNIVIAGLLLAASAAQAQGYIPARPFVGMPGRDFPMPPNNYSPPHQLYTPPPPRPGTVLPSPQSSPQSQQLPQPRLRWQTHKELTPARVRWLS